MPLIQALIRNPYSRLMRLHQPVGVLLLMWPCWWSIALASGGRPSPILLALFAAGALIMRAAGCIINDLWDRKIDAQVERTRSRPLASGEVSVKQALALLALLLTLALLIALQLGWHVVVWSALALPLVVLYPFMKRITWWPQAFLGLTFNWGALLGTVAVHGAPDSKAFLLYAAGFFWTLGYDTIYAHQDAADDARVGVKSTARYFAGSLKNAVSMFYAACIVCLIMTGVAAHVGALYYAFLVLTAAHFTCQIRQIDVNNPSNSGRIFRQNASVGALVFVGCVLA